MATTATPEPMPTHTPQSTPTEALDGPVVRETSTPLAPAPLAGQTYRLRAWTPQQAEALIQMLRAYPDSLGLFDRGYHDSGYYSAYQYTLFAEQDALARFPSAGFAANWIWDAAYNQAQMGDSLALDAYARLIEEALRTGQATPDALPTWFARQETRLVLTVATVPDQPGYLITIADTWGGSGGFLWLVDPGPAARVEPLHTAGLFGDFGFSSADGIGTTWLDVTGDGQPELLTRHAWMPGSLDAGIANLDIFDVSVVPPQAISFSQDRSQRPTQSITATVDASGRPILHLAYIFDRMYCPFEYSDAYRWDGASLVWVGRAYPTVDVIRDQSGPECADQLVGALMQRARAGDLRQFDATEAYLEGWPYGSEAWWPNDDSAPDVRDRGRFVLGLIAALNNATDLARRVLERIVASPATADSRWVAPARDFLAAYSDAVDFPAACRAVAVCAELLQPDDLVRIAAMDSTNHPAILLRDLGLSVRTSGEQDVDGDGDLDAWLTLGDGVERAPLWIFLTVPGGRTTLQAGSAAADGQVSFAAPPPNEPGPIVAPITREGVRYWRIKPRESAGHWVASDLCSELASAQRTASSRVLAWEAQAPTVKDLEALRGHVAELCPGWTKTYGDYYDAATLYAIGLAAERAGDLDRATSAYLEVWQEYPRGAFALMAQARLEPEP